MELRWRDMHTRLVIYIANQLQVQLPEPLVAQAEETVLVDMPAEPPARLQPDVTVAEDRPGPEDGGIATLAPPATIAKPILVIVPEPEVDRHIEIIDTASGGRVITAIELLSPTNKVPGAGRRAYRSKQQAFVSAGVNLVEIDLIRKGEWAFSIDEAALVSDARTPYMACVFRATQPGLRALYRLPLREPLPRMAIPLRPNDRDVVLDLQKVINEAYETGRYDRLDHTRALDPPLAPEDAAWAANLLPKAGRVPQDAE